MGVEEDAEGEGEEALCDPLGESSWGFREVVFESHLLFEVREHAFDCESL